MEKIKTTKDIDNAIESTGASILDFDTVAMWNETEKEYGIYVKSPTLKDMWELKMTCLNLKLLGE